MAINPKSLLRPPLFPSCHSDESPIGYLSRIAELNGYSNYEWLFDQDIKTKGITEPANLFQLLSSVEWTGFSQADASVKEISKLNRRYLFSNLRCCPACLYENGYRRAVWQIKYSIACPIHKIWLQDSCSRCGHTFSSTGENFGKCSCDYMDQLDSRLPASTEVLRWQAFVEGTVVDVKTDFPFLLTEQVTLRIRQRINIVHLMARWSRRVSGTLSVDTNRFSPSTSESRAFIEDTAGIIFGGRSGYCSFLTRLLQREDEITTHYAFGNFTEYYRNFNKFCGDKFFAKFRRLNDEFVGSWTKSITRRNSSFTEDVLEKHEWIAFQVACNKYQIHKSVLRRCLNTFSIEHAVHTKEKRSLIDIYEPDLVRKLYRIRDIITSKEAAFILGLTKLQFSQLRSTGCFTDAVPPKPGHCAEWQFSRQEVIHYLSNYVNPTLIELGDVISVAYIFKHYGATIRDPISTVLHAIQNGELKCVSTQRLDMGIRGLLLSRQEFFEWYER